MKPISAVVVEKTRQAIGEFSEARIVGLMDQMSQEQPVIVAFLIAAGEELLSQEEKELFVYLGTVVWQIMSKGEKTLKQVTEKRLLDADAANTKMISSLVDTAEGTLVQSFQSSVTSYPQPDVLRFVVEALEEAAEEEEGISSDHIGIMIMNLKTVIDCLNQ